MWIPLFAKLTEKENNTNKDLTSNLKTILIASCISFSDLGQFPAPSPKNEQNHPEKRFLYFLKKLYL